MRVCVKEDTYHSINIKSITKHQNQNKSTCYRHTPSRQLRAKDQMINAQRKINIKVKYFNQ